MRTPPKDSISKITRRDFIKKSASAAIAAHLARIESVFAGPSNFNFWSDQNTNQQGTAYICGGNDGAVTSDIEGMVFATETMLTISNNLPAARNVFGTFKSATKGYFCGGASGGSHVSSMGGFTFATETAADIAANLSLARFGFGAFESTTIGYCYGGWKTSGGTVYYSEIDGLTFSTEAAYNPAISTTSNRNSSTGTCSASTGYSIGGSVSGTAFSCLEYFRFADETNGITANSIPNNQLQTAGNRACTYRDTKAYIGGGTSNTSYISRFVFESEANANTGLSLKAPVSHGALATGSTAKGYFANGRETAGSTKVSNIDGIIYSTETNANITKVLDIAREDSSCFESKSAPAGSGFIGGGTTSISNIDKIQFATEARGRISSNLVNIKYKIGHSGVGTISHGYFTAGQDSGSVALSSFEKLTFSSESVTSTTSTLSVARSFVTHIASQSFLYVCGGQDSSGSVYLSSIDGISFATDAAFGTGLVLSVVRRSCSGYSTNSHGYVCGHRDTAGGYSSIDRLAWATEAVTTLAANLVQTRGQMASVQSNTHGYSCGGFQTATSYSEIDGIVFATEAANNPAAVLTVARSNPIGVSSYLIGYTCGGGSSSGEQVDGITFSTEAAYNPTWGLTEIRSQGGAVQNTDLRNHLYSGNGYLAGGLTTAPAFISSIYKMNFSTFACSALAANLPAGRSNLAGVNGRTEGYWAGGRESGVNFCSNIDGIDFSTEALDNIAATLAGVTRRGASGIQTFTKGYFCGGQSGAATYESDIDALTFATEATSNPAAVLSVARVNTCGGSSPTAGYVFGGYDGTNYYSEIDGLTFSTEAATNPAATLSVAVAGPTCMQSSSKAYIAGGVDAAANYSHINAFTFASETRAATSATLAIARGPSDTGMSSCMFGICATGVEYTSTTAYSEIDGILFSTEASFNPTATVGVSVAVAGAVYSGGMPT